MLQFLKDHPELKLKMWYNETLRSWYFEVYTHEFLHGFRPIKRFVIYEDEIGQESILSFDELVGQKLFLWWESLEEVYEMD